jgi:hypothetical protein
VLLGIATLDHGVVGLISTGSERERKVAGISIDATRESFDFTQEDNNIGFCVSELGDLPVFLLMRAVHS